MDTSELTGFGLGACVRPGPGEPADERGHAELRALLHRHGVLVVRGLDLDRDRYVAFAAGFGPLETVFPAAHQDPGYPTIRLQSNVAGQGVAGGGEYWHADGPLTEVPTAVTLLWCETAPDTGGETLFADMARAFERLQARKRSALADRRGWYPCREIALREMRAAGVPEDEQREKLAQLRDLHHPVVRRHPTVDRTALYLNQQWMRAIEGEADGTLLEHLYAVATADDNVYRHRWLPNDVLIWDNALVMHKALPPAPGNVKTTRRITVAGCATA